MKISELIKELEGIKSDHGDLDMDISAYYQGGYTCGDSIDEIEVCDTDRWVSDISEPGGYKNIKLKVARLISYEKN